MTTSTRSSGTLARTDARGCRQGSRGQGPPSRAQGGQGGHSPTRARPGLRPLLAGRPARRAPGAHRRGDPGLVLAPHHPGAARRGASRPAPRRPGRRPLARAVRRLRRPPAGREPHACTRPTTVPPLPDLAELWARAVDRDDVTGTARLVRDLVKRRAGALAATAASCTGGSTRSPPSSSPATASSPCWRCRSCRRIPLTGRGPVSGAGEAGGRFGRAVPRGVFSALGRRIGHTVPCRSPPRPHAARAGRTPTWTTCS